MLKEYDRVRIKNTGITGEIIDIYESGDKTMYTIESDEKGTPGGRGDPDSWKWYECEESELEKL